MIRIGKKNEGISITFELRGVEPEIVDDVWHDLRPYNIIFSTKETGTCLLTYGDIAAEVRKTKKGNYTVWFGKESK